MYMCICIYMYMYMYVYMYVCICIYICMCIYVCVCVCDIYVCMYMCMMSSVVRVSFLVYDFSAILIIYGQKQFISYGYMKFSDKFGSISLISNINIDILFGFHYDSS